MSDPLSFFAVDTDDSDSDEETPPDTENSTKRKTSNEGETKPHKKLPPPLDALAGAKRPEFTTCHINQDIDWDKLTKKAPVVPEKEYKPWENRLPTVDQSVKTKAGKTEKTLAQQAPGASAPNKANGPVQGRPQEYVDHAMQWSKMYQTMDESGNVKRARPEDIGGEKGFMFTDLQAQRVAYKGAKRAKTNQQTPESFRAKEAKKRTLGQANKDKMFVEDEKRILRQQFDTNY